MTKTMKIIIAAVAGLLVLGVIAAGGLFLAVTKGFAQTPSATDTPAATQAPAATAQPGATTQNSGQAYEDFFLNAFANRLGVTVDKIKEAFTGAAGDTLDQAVKDGKLTQARADQMKTNLQDKMNQGILPFFNFELGKRGFFGDFDHGGFGRGFGPGFFGRGGFKGLMGLGLDSFAKALNMNVSDLQTELQSGKTLADVVKEKNADLSQVKTSVLNDLKTNLDQAVTNGKLTQSQADSIYNQASTNFDTLVTQTWPAKPFGGGWMHQ